MIWYPEGIIILRQYMSKVNTDKTLISKFLTQGVAEVIVREELEEKLLSGDRIRVYFGIDPTGDVIHIGHAIVLKKLRILQDMGHEVILLIGSFTSLIGDPTGKDSTRPPLTQEDVANNAKNYQEQAAKILDFKGDNPVQIRYNADWLAKMTMGDLLGITSHLTVGQLLERDMFQERIKAGREISLTEFMYPLMQGYDSVVMEADLEIGGSDQLFNMLTGRTLRKKIQNETKAVLTCELLEGLDGRKMSKSYGNTVNLTDEPNDMFGKLMSISDDLIIRYFKLCTDVSEDTIKTFENDLESEANPRDIKVQLAKEIVAIYHSADLSNAAADEFKNVFSNKQKPSNMPELTVESEMQLDALIIKAGFAKSKNEAHRLIEQGGVKLDDNKITDWKETVKISDGMILQGGKRNFGILRVD